MPSGNESLLRPGESHGSRSSVQGKKIYVLFVSFALSIFSFAVELTVGRIAGSLSVVSDAFHMLSDAFGYGVSIFAVYLAKQTGDSQNEVYGSLISIILIWLISLYFLGLAIQKIMNPIPVNGLSMIAMGVFGLIVNYIQHEVLEGEHDHHHSHDHEQEHDHEHGHEHEHEHEHEHDHDHDHEHDHSHSEHTALNKRDPESGIISKVPSMIIEVAKLHVIQDALFNIAILIAGLIIIINPTWVMADPILTILFAFLVLFFTKDSAIRIYKSLRN